jgi:hypothetical protein
MARGSDKSVQQARARELQIMTEISYHNNRDGLRYTESMTRLQARRRGKFSRLHVDILMLCNVLCMFFLSLASIHVCMFSDIFWLGAAVVHERDKFKVMICTLISCVVCCAQFTQRQAHFGASRVCLTLKAFLDVQTSSHVGSMSSFWAYDWRLIPHSLSFAHLLGC